jgi:hypothetical protein
LARADFTLRQTCPLEKTPRILVLKQAKAAVL